MPQRTTNLASRAASTLGTGIARLLIPVACPGCALADVIICRECLEPLTATPRRVEQGAPRLDRLDGTAPMPVWTLAEYVGCVRDTIVAWKDRGRSDLDPLLGALAYNAGLWLGPRLEAAGATDVVVVPMPSSRRSERQRGRRPVTLIAAHVAHALTATGPASTMIEALTQRRGVRDQVGLSGRQRGANLRSALHQSAPLPVNIPVLLVDDVLTTGATLAAAHDTLSQNGTPVLGAMTLVATPSPSG